MGVIEDTRQVLQDFLAPELHALSARLDALEKRMDERFTYQDKKIDDAERRAERRHDEVMIALRQVIDMKALQQRMDKLESQQVAHQ